MATASSVCNFSPAGASRQSIISFQRRLSGGRRSGSAVGPAGSAMGPTLGPAVGGLRGRGGLSSMGGLARRHVPRLIVDGKDVSPGPLYDVDDRPQAPTGWDILTGLGTLGPTMMMHTARSASSGFLVTRDSSMGTSMGFLTPYGNLAEATRPSTLSVLSTGEDPAPSAFVLPRHESLKGAPPSTPVKFVLSETPTFTLLDVDSLSAPADSDQGEEVRLDNARLQEFRDTVHTFNDAEVQTAPIWVRSSGTNLPRIRRKNATVQATPWNIFDVERGDASATQLPVKPQEEQQQQKEQQADRRVLQRRRRLLRRTVLDRISSQRSLSLSDADTVESKDDTVLPVDEKMRYVLQLPSFRRAALLAERVAAEYAFRERQKQYRGLPSSDPLSADLRFEYKLEVLWQMECEWAAGRAVTCLTWNKANPDLLAVGYGRYLQQDQATGLVCMWSAKNPLLPERLYRFNSPVSALSFSSSRPNLLAVAMYNGSLALVDVSATDKSVVADAGEASESGAPSPSWEPLWSVTWMSGHEFQQEDEVLVTSGQDGRVTRWRRAERGLQPTPMLRVPMAEGGEQGVQPLAGRCPGTRTLKDGAEAVAGEVGLRQFAAVLCMEPLPGDPLTYMVATEDGCVHTCSTNYLHQHVAISAAHAGPVYRLSFSPFCDKVFLTCGADWTVRLWAVGIKEPLVTLVSGMQAVEDASWSPRNSTIIASLSGDELCMWDLRRKTYVPASRTPWLGSAPPTRLLFSAEHDNLVVADRDGRAVAFALRDMPFAPYYQGKALAAALERALATKPALLAGLRKLGEPFATT